MQGSETSHSNAQEIILNDLPGLPEDRSVELGLFSSWKVNLGKTIVNEIRKGHDILAFHKDIKIFKGYKEDLYNKES